MAEKKPVRKTKSKTQAKNSQLAALEDEIQDLHGAIDELHEDIKKLVPKSAGKRALNQILVGILRGLGLVIGTTIIAGALFFAVREALQSPAVQAWIGGAIQNALETVIENNVPELPF